ncbi:MAG: hypothetical protein ABIS35_03155 [Terracoccus sp.]
MLSAVLALTVVGGVSACSSGSPDVTLTQERVVDAPTTPESQSPLPTAPSTSATGTPTPAMTVTATVTATQVVAPTATVTATTTVTASATAAPTVTVTALPRPALTSSSVFDEAAATRDYSLLVSDVTALDAMTVSGPAAALRLDAMAGHFATLAANGGPPGLDLPSYRGRIGTLQLFAAAAAEEATAGSPQAAARYAVIRQETATFLALVNGALKTAYALPTPTPTP